MVAAAAGGSRGSTAATQVNSEEGAHRRKARQPDNARRPADKCGARRCVKINVWSRLAHTYGLGRAAGGSAASEDGVVAAALAQLRSPGLGSAMDVGRQRGPMGATYRTHGSDLDPIG